MNLDQSELKHQVAEAAERWPEADPAERQHLLDPIGESLTRAFEAPAPPVSPERFDNPGLLGRYDDEHFRIEMNDRLFEAPDPSRALDTYLHEYRHAAQSYEIAKSQGALAHEVNVGEALAFERNRSEYVDPVDDFEGYWSQPIERDAREFSATLRNEIAADRKGRE